MTLRLPAAILIATLLVGGAAHAGEFSLGGARLIADNASQSSVDVTVSFTDRHASRDAAEGGDVRNPRGVDGPAPATPDTHNDAPAPKRVVEAPSTSDAPHGVSISPNAIKRPSYRWQSLVPGTIK
jgi:hypothetical protein